MGMIPLFLLTVWRLPNRPAYLPQTRKREKPTNAGGQSHVKIVWNWRTPIATIISYFLLRTTMILAYDNGNLIVATGFQPVIVHRLGNLRYDRVSPKGPIV